jgi:hypothetical protein
MKEGTPSFSFAGRRSDLFFLVQRFMRIFITLVTVKKYERNFELDTFPEEEHDKKREEDFDQSEDR